MAVDPTVEKARQEREAEIKKDAQMRFMLALHNQYPGINLAYEKENYLGADPNAPTVNAVNLTTKPLEKGVYKIKGMTVDVDEKLNITIRDFSLKNVNTYMEVNMGLLVKKGAKSFKIALSDKFSPQQSYAIIDKFLKLAETSHPLPVSIAEDETTKKMIRGMSASQQEDIARRIEALSLNKEKNQVLAAIGRPQDVTKSTTDLAAHTKLDSADRQADFNKQLYGATAGVTNAAPTELTDKLAQYDTALASMSKVADKDEDVFKAISKDLESLNSLLEAENTESKILRAKDAPEFLEKMRNQIEATKVDRHQNTTAIKTNVQDSKDRAQFILDKLRDDKQPLLDEKSALEIRIIPGTTTETEKADILKQVSAVDKKIGLIDAQEKKVNDFVDKLPKVADVDKLTDKQKNAVDQLQQLHDVAENHRKTSAPTPTRSG